MSLPLTVVRTLLPLRKRSTESAETLHAAIAERSGEAPVPAGVRRSVRITERLVNGLPVVRLDPLRERDGPAPAHLIYAHGGCYTFGILGLHWQMLAHLVRISGTGIDVPLYGLAPEHTADEAYELYEQVYQQATAESPGKVFLGGDSAGGGLALGQALRYRDRGLPAPRGLILISPWVDVTMTNPGIAPLERLDPMLAPAGLMEAGRLWAGDRELRDPMISPIYGELSGLAPVHTYVGDHDILAADAKELTRRLILAGNDAELRLTRGGFHVFPAVGILPESRLALARIAKVLQSA